MTTKTILTLSVIVLLAVSGKAQISNFAYKRQFTPAASGWQQIDLPDSLFSKLNRQLTDLRVYGLSPTGDTIEAPYLLVQRKPKPYEGQLSVRMLNKSKRNGQTYRSFMLREPAIIDRIELEIDAENYDWRLQLEGSQNQTEWFTILHNYRVVGFHNPISSYSFSTLLFPPSKYKYYRLAMPSASDANFRQAALIAQVADSGRFRNYPVNLAQENLKDAKQSLIKLRTRLAVPVSQISLHVLDTIDYVRSVQISYLTDSAFAANKWHYHYAEIYNGPLSSFEPQKFYFSTRIASEWQIRIDNHDDQPLHITAAELSGPVYEMQVRLPTDSAQWALYYGSNHMSAPNYDLQYFAHKIPNHMPPVQLQTEQQLQAPPAAKPEPSRWWLWAAMGSIMLLLVVFSLRMLRSETANN